MAHEPKTKTVAAMKVAIRTDRRAGVVRASFASMNEEVSAEISTISTVLVDTDKEAFEDWVRMLKKAMNRLIKKSIGVDPVNTIRMRPTKGMSSK